VSIGSSHVRVANGIVATTAHGQGCQPSQLRAHANGAHLDELGLIDAMRRWLDASATRDEDNA
jgi:hypothetical protein